MMKVITQIIVQLVLWLLLGTIAQSATQQPAPPRKKPLVKAFRLTEAINLDGKLSEKFWKDENAVTDFIQRDPVEGAAPTEKTAVDIGYDDSAIYFAARMYDSEPNKIEARLVRRDTDINSDSFTVYIDPYHDRQTGYYFGVNAGGTLYDGTLFNDGWDDNSWDGVWEGKAHRDEKGWTVEIRVPYSQLRFQKQKTYVWGINFKRHIARKNEDSFLVYCPKNENGFVSRFPDLTGIQDIVPARRFEVIPYMTTKAAYIEQDAGNPFNDGSEYDPGVGVDLKLGLGTNLTLDATVNPDFGQVEVDPAVVNLSDVETFFTEKRPFFIEGANIFRFGEGGANNFWGFNWSSPTLFYSRRIGRTPQGSTPDDTDYENVPAGTQILGAGKLTGKIANGWNVGTLHALTGRETADVLLFGQQSRTEVEPRTYYQVTRAQREFNGGNQGFGVLGTFASRLFEDLRLENEINSKSLVVGFDGWTFLDSNKTWVLTGYTAASRVTGSTGRITDLQENSQHYFQRPDADYVDVDADATSLSGYAGRLHLNKEKGNVFVNSAFGFISPGFDSNDVGFLFRADVINSHVGGGYKWTTPGKFYRFVEMGFAAFRSWDYDWNTVWGGLFHFGYIELPNYYTIDYSLAWNPEETYNNTRTRGGPRTLNLPGYEANLLVGTDNRKQWIFGGGGNLYQSDSSEYRSLNGKVEWKPASNVSFSVGPRIDIDRIPAFWVDTFDDELATHTFGKRYVFANLNQRTFSADLRLNWTFTPQLSLQLFAQPLVSAGDYTNFKELARPSSYDFNVYSDVNTTLNADEYSIDPDGAGPARLLTFTNPDFNFRSLRGNAILRWEYKPGSTIYFVWTQSRESEETLGEFQFGRSFDRLWDARPDNIFLVKFSYYWNL